MGSGSKRNAYTGKFTKINEPNKGISRGWKAQEIKFETARIPGKGIRLDEIDCALRF
jgi:hypothetical protein